MMTITCAADLRALDQWVVFDLVPQPNGKKPRKVPRIPGTNHPAHVDKPGTWRSHAEAVADGRPAGVVLTPAMGLTLIDIDGQDDHALIATLDSYTERSLNGGLHILVRGRPPAGFVAPAGIEIYPRDGNRFLILTEALIDGRDTIEDRTEILAEMFPPAARSTAPLAELGLDDQKILANGRTMAGFGPLYDRGDLSVYDDDQSRADLGLLNYLVVAGATSADQLDRLFRQSALMRDKWDERRGATTYGERTIAKALDGTVVPFEGFAPASTIARAGKSRQPAVPLAADSQTLRFAPGPCADRVAQLEAENAALREALAGRDRTIAALDAKVAVLEQMQPASAKILANKSLGPSRVVAATVATKIAWRASAGDTPPAEATATGTPPPGMMLVSVKEIAESAGVSENTAGAHLKTLEDRGLLRRQLKTVTLDANPHTGELYDEPVHITAHFIGPAQSETLTPQSAITFSRNLADFTTERAERRGGKRIPRCPEHPTAPVVREFVDRCGIPSCKRELNSGTMKLPDMLLEPALDRSPKFGDHSTAVVDRLEHTNFGDRHNGYVPQPVPLDRTLIAGWVGD